MATRRIRSGQNVRVDGDAGTVTLLGGVDGGDGARPVAIASEQAISSKARKISLAALGGVFAIVAFALWKRCKRA